MDDLGHLCDKLYMNQEIQYGWNLLHIKAYIVRSLDSPNINFTLNHLDKKMDEGLENNTAW